MKFIDTTGHLYRGFLVVRDGGPPKPGCYKVLVRCQKGHEFLEYKNHLRNPKRRTICHECTNGEHGNFRDMTGERFGHLVVLRRLDHEFAECRCRCRGVVVRRVTYLRSAKNHIEPLHCGCLSDLITVDGISLQASGWANVLSVSRERVRQLRRDGKLIGRIKEALSATESTPSDRSER